MNLHPLGLVVLVAALFAPVYVHGQATSSCPAVWVNGPTSDVPHGKPIVFSARLNPNATSRPEFRWEISAGTIVSGQGTASITVDTAGLGGVTVTARVMVSGIATLCSTEASRSANVYPEGIICGLPLDNYGDINFEDEQARLDNFAIQLTNEPDATGYIFVYAGRRTYEGEAEEHLIRARRHLVEYREIDADRVVTINGGYKEELNTILIIAPKGAAPPVAMPELSPHEIELTKPVPKRRRRKQSN